MVSGTKKKVKTTAEALTIANSQKVPYVLSTCTRLRNVLVTKNPATQAVAPTIDVAVDRVLSGNISPMSNHGRGPKPIEYAIM